LDSLSPEEVPALDGAEELEELSNGVSKPVAYLLVRPSQQ